MINPNEYGSLLFDEKEKEYSSNVIDTRRIFRYSKTQYPYTSMCEEIIKNLVGSNYCLMTTNGTSSLKSAFIGANVKKGDRVLISSYTFLATALAAIAVGAIPIPIEVDLDYGVNIEDLKNEIKLGCKTLVVVHFQGRTFDLSEVKRICKKNGVILIEDACQAFGAKFKDKHAGTFGEIGVYSFQQFKQITCGEGGCVVTNNELIFNRMRNYTDMGSTRNRFPSWDSDEALFGENNRMNNLCAAVLYAQLEKLDKIISKQRKSRENIMKKLGNINNILTSKDSTGDTCMNIIIILNDKKFKEEVINIGKENDIEFRNMWPSLYYDNELFKKYKLTSKDLKNKECSYTRELIDKMLVVSIPPILNNVDEEKIASLIQTIKNKGYLS